MKITVIGGGSSYTPELISGILEHSSHLPVQELWLMDIDKARLEIVGGFAQRIVRAQGNPFHVHLSTHRPEAIEGASYIITQLRVGQLPARREDEYLGKRHGLIGQETNGVGGMAKALRTIPVLLDITADMRRLAPKALLVNFTNPSGLNTEALQHYAPDIASVGVCNNPITTSMGLLEMLREVTGKDLPAGQARLDTLGLNHFGWYRGFTVDGVDYWPTILQHYERIPDRLFDTRTVQTLGLIPNQYLQYYYYTADRLSLQDQWPPSRAEIVMEVERELLKQYADPALNTPPADLMKRGGAYYSTLATRLIAAHYNNSGEVHILNTRHNGAATGYPAEWVMEMPCRVDAQGIHPLPASPLPPECNGLLSAIKMYELLTVEAAVHGDRSAAYKALLTNPLGPSADRVEAVLDDLLQTNRAFLPAFFT